MILRPATLWRRNNERKRYLARKGVIVCFSVVRQAPLQLEKRVPYVVALVEMRKERTIAQVVDCELEDLHIGMKVVGVMRKLFDVDNAGLHVYGVKFSPMMEKE